MLNFKYFWEHQNLQQAMRTISCVVSKVVHVMPYRGHVIIEIANAFLLNKL